MPRQQPNVILITSDQHRGDCFGFEGRPVKTPHLDRLAAKGARFSNCITPNNVCQPSRASILTGLLPNTHGVHDNGIDLDPALGKRGMAGTLQRAGITTAFIGKAHFSTHHTFKPTGTPECKFSQQNYSSDWRGPYMGFEHVELVVNGHNHDLPAAPPAGQHYECWYYGDGRGADKNRLYRSQLEPHTHAAHTWHSALPSVWHNSTWVGNRTIDFLRNTDEQPFFLWASFPDPHHPFDAPDPWSRMHHPEEIDLPPHRTKDLDRRPWWHAASLERTPNIQEDFRLLRETRSRVPDQTDVQLRQMISNYYGMISLIDHSVGRIVDYVSRIPRARNTIIIFTSDHGDWLGDHGLLLKGPMMYEGLVRVGLIVQGPEITPGLTLDHPVSTLDVAATVLDYFDVSADLQMHGKSLKPLLNGMPQQRDFAYNEWSVNPSRCGVELELRMARTRRHKLTLELLSGAGEMYDLFDDPLEMNNLFRTDQRVPFQNELLDMINSRPDDAVHPRIRPVGMA